MAEPEACAILKSQANKVFQLLAEAGLDPCEFQWRMVRSTQLEQDVSRLEHGPTGYFFQFDYYWSDYFKGHRKMSIYSPSDESRLARTSAENDWSTQLKTVERWVGNVAREALAPDLWAEVQKARQFTDAAAAAGEANLPFTAEEQARIMQALGEIREYLNKTLSPTTERLSSIEARLEYLQEASTRLGRKDWVMLALGTVTSLIISLQLSGDLAREVFRLAGTLFAWVSRVQPSLP